MNRTGLFIALALALVLGLLFGIYPELDLKLAALFYDAANKTFPLKFNTLAAFARDGAMWIAWGLALPAIVALLIKLARPDKPLLMSGRAIVFLLGDAVAVRRRAHQSHLQELLGPAASDDGDAVQWRPGVRAVVGSARWLRPQLFVLLRRRRHRVLDLRARGVDAAGMAAAGLCRRDPVRRHDQRAADGVRRAFLHRRRGGRAGDFSGDLAGARLHLPLALDPAIRRGCRCRADALCLAGISHGAALARTCTPAGCCWGQPRGLRAGEVVGDLVEGRPAHALVGVDVLDEPLEHRAAPAAGRRRRGGWSS